MIAGQDEHSLCIQGFDPVPVLEDGVSGAAVTANTCAEFSAPRFDKTLTSFTGSPPHPGKVLQQGTILVLG
jgi:hypothetical protein